MPAASKDLRSSATPVPWRVAPSPSMVRLLPRTTRRMFKIAPFLSATLLVTTMIVGASAAESEANIGAKPERTPKRKLRARQWKGIGLMITLGTITTRRGEGKHFVALI